MQWHDLLTAFALYLVLEGLLPFANPNGFRAAMVRFIGQADSTLRKLGAASMLAGLVLLYFVR